MQVLKNAAVKKPFERLSDQRTYYRHTLVPAVANGAVRIARAILASRFDGHRPTLPNGDARTLFGREL